MKPQDVTLSQRMMQTGKHGYFQVPAFLRMWIPRDFDVEERPQVIEHARAFYSRKVH